MKLMKQFSSGQSVSVKCSALKAPAKPMLNTITTATRRGFVTPNKRSHLASWLDVCGNELRELLITAHSHCLSMMRRLP